MCSAEVFVLRRMGVTLPLNPQLSPGSPEVRRGPAASGPEGVDCPQAGRPGEGVPALGALASALTALASGDGDPAPH